MDPSRVPRVYPKPTTDFDGFPKLGRPTSESQISLLQLGPNGEQHESRPGTPMQSSEHVPESPGSSAGSALPPHSDAAPTAEEDPHRTIPSTSVLEQQ